MSYDEIEVVEGVGDFSTCVGLWRLLTFSVETSSVVFFGITVALFDSDSIKILFKSILV